MGKNQYWAGFQLLTELETSGYKSFLVANGVAISVGDVIGFAAGYVQRATTLQGVPIAGVAASANTTGDAAGAGVVTARIIPIYPHNRFMVPVEQNAKITQAAVGTLVDLQSAGTIDIGDLVTLGYGFFIEAIDISSPAILANAFGFAIGHFEYVAAS